MITIDIVGAPGSGKTTLVRGLIHRGTDILAPKQLFVRASLSRNHDAHRLLSQTNRLLLLIGASKLVPIGQKYRVLEAQGAPWGDFLEFCLTLASAVRPTFPTIAGLTWLWESAFVRALAENHRSGGQQVVVFDEPLSFRPSVLNLSNEDLRPNEPYFHLVPAPTAVIVLKAAPEVIQRRIEMRQLRTGRVLDRHEGMTNAEVLADIEKLCELAMKCGEILRARGVPCLEVSSEQPAKQTIDAAKRFAQTVMSNSIDRD